MVKLFVCVQDGLVQEELSTYADDVFESPSEAAIRENDANKMPCETDLTGSALGKPELERSHLMLWVFILLIHTHKHQHKHTHGQLFAYVKVLFIVIILNTVSY